MLSIAVLMREEVCAACRAMFAAGHARRFSYCVGTPQRGDKDGRCAACIAAGRTVPENPAERGPGLIGNEGEAAGASTTAEAPDAIDDVGDDDPEAAAMPVYTPEEVLTRTGALSASGGARNPRRSTRIRAAAAAALAQPAASIPQNLRVAQVAPSQAKRPCLERSATGGADRPAGGYVPGYEGQEDVYVAVRILEEKLLRGKLHYLVEWEVSIVLV